MWVFAAVAPGLVLDKANTEVVKPTSEAEIRPIGDSKTMSKSTHAFTARARSTSEAKVDEKQQCSLEVHSTEPFLVGLAPAKNWDSSEAAETSAEFDARVLGTPLSWEEPFSYFFECSKKGVFFWSESEAAYGVPIADKCVEETGGIIHLKWEATEEGKLSMSLGNNVVGDFRVPFSRPEADVELVPHVTLMKPGSLARIVE